MQGEDHGKNSNKGDLMPRICVRIATSEVIPDFQSNPIEGSLIINAVNAGLGKADEFEEQVVDKATFQGHLDDYKAQFAVAVAAETTARTNAKASIKQKFLALGFTLQELKYMRDFISGD